MPGPCGPPPLPLLGTPSHAMRCRGGFAQVRWLHVIAPLYRLRFTDYNSRLLPPLQAYVSRTEYPEWAIPCLKTFLVAGSTSMFDVSHHQVGACGGGGACT